MDALAERLGISPARLDVALDRHPAGTRSPRPVNVLADLAVCVSVTAELDEKLGRDAVDGLWMTPRPHSHTLYWTSARRQRRTSRLRPHSLLDDLLWGRAELVANELLSRGADLVYPPVTPGALYDPNSPRERDTVVLAEWMCDSDEDLELFRSLSVGSLGWVELDPGSRLEFVVRSLEGGEGRGELTGTVRELAAVEAWGLEWDWVREFAPAAAEDLAWHQRAPHPYSPRLWSGEGALRLHLHRLSGLPLYVKDAAVWLRHHQVSAMEGYLTGPFAQWPWLRPFAPTLSPAARSRRSEISARLSGRPRRWGLGLRAGASGPVPVPVWILSWLRSTERPSQEVRHV